MSRQPFLSSAVVTLAGLLCSPFAGAEMAPLDDAGMAEVSGRGGIYLSGDISINELGGPLQNNYFGRCDDQDKKCGARLAYQLKEGGGWMVLDEIRGMFAFEGLTLRVRSIDSRSEERRVGKECRSRWSACHGKEKSGREDGR